ncbi:MAG: TetR/AcrR family transcriptional regulator [Nocardioidaceae bacterium]
MGRRKVEVRREEILSAAVTSMRERGMDQTRVQDVAAAMGISTGLVFYHFATKDNLLAAALEHAVGVDLARLDRALARGRSPVDRLKRVLASYGPTGPAAGWTLWIDAWSSALRHAAIRKKLRTLDDRWRAALRETITEGVAAGDLRCPDPDASVARIGALLDGLSVAALVYGSVTRTQLRTWLREAVAAETGATIAELS